MKEHFLTVVPPQEPNLADVAWEKWKLENPELAGSLTAEDVIKDHICGVDHKARVRYRIRIRTHDAD